MKIKIVDINGLITYTDTKNIVALNSYKNSCYDVRYRVLIGSQALVSISKETFEKLAKLLYNNIELEIE